MLDKDLEKSINQSFQDAKLNNHEFVTVEHLLIALINNPSVIEVFNVFQVNVASLSEDLRVFLDKYVATFPQKSEMETTLGFKRVLQRAIFYVQSSHKKQVSGVNVLVAIFSENDSHAVYCLSRQNLTKLDIVDYLSHGIRIVEYDDSAYEEEQPTQTFEKFTINLNKKAISGKIETLVGRTSEIERSVQILSRKTKNNPILVGEAGVGKTSIVEGLAKSIVDGDVPEVLVDSVIYSLDIAAMLAGTKYRGDFEKRMKVLISKLKEKPYAILFIDEIHMLIGAGSVSGGVIDASNMLKPVLISGEIKCIGSTTYQEYRNIVEKDHAFSRRFQKIDVKEPSCEETINILTGLKSGFEKYHKVQYTSEALKSAVRLTEHYITDRYFPDKAIDIIDEAGAAQKVLPKSKRKKRISSNDIERLIAKITGIPVSKVSFSDRELLRHLERDLRLVVFGQDRAISELSNAIKMSRSGLGDKNKPVGSFLFSGSTGVGKTEVARQLANYMNMPLIRLDMSEYMEKHSVSRLIGAPPGYVGFDQGGLLTEKVNKQPYSILLLDEIEKAHADVFNLLLQVFDHGTLTDTNGRSVDFRNTLIIMTTNAGSDQLNRSSLGFSEQNHRSDVMLEINKMFSPEFRNRLDHIIQFNTLDKSIILKIANKLISELEVNLNQKNVSMKVENEVYHWLADHGYSKDMGARPMKRVIQKHIKQPLSDSLLFGRLEHGGFVCVGVKNDQIHLKFLEGDQKEISLTNSLELRL